MKPAVPRGAISLGDLAHALARLPWTDDDQAQAIAASLGFGALKTSEFSGDGQPAGRRIFDPALDHRPPPPRNAQEAIPAFPTPPSLPPPVSTPKARLSATLVELPTAAIAADKRPDWLDDASVSFVEQPALPPVRKPLLPDLRVRGVLEAALATRRAGSAPDLAALVRQLAAGRLARGLPRLAESTLSHGCQLLLDYSDSMIPWWEDLGSLAEQVLRVVGEAPVYSFEGDPATASRWLPGAEDAQPWRPSPGRPILAASDLGIRGMAQPRCAPRGWREFAQRCAAAGSPLVVLVPWPQRYWPNDLGRHASLVHWHPHTSAAMLRRSFGAGHRGRP